MEFTAAEIATILEGEIIGEPSVRVHTLSKIQEGTAGSISFLSNPKYESFLYETQASIVIVDKDFHPRQSLNTTLIKVKDAYLAFSLLLKEYQKLIDNQYQGIEQPSYIAEGVILGESIYVGAFAYIGAESQIGDKVKIYPQAYIGKGVRIGEGSIIYPGAKICAGSVIGKYCVVQAGAVIGSEGFGYAPQDDGTYLPIPQIGNVVLEDFVEIGANTTIDRATIGSTLIQTGCKLDNLIQIAHNVLVGSHTVIAAQAGVAGSAVIGAYNLIGGQVGIVGHIKTAEKTSIQAQSGVAASIDTPGTAWQGSPAEPIRNHLKNQVIFRKLPEIEKRISKLERDAQPDAQK